MNKEKMMLSTNSLPWKELLEKLKNSSEEIYPGCDVSIPFRGDETCWFKVLGIGINPSIDDIITGNFNFVDLIHYDYDMKIYDNDTEYGMSTGEDPVSVCEILVNMYEELGSEIQNYVLERKILTPYGWAGNGAPTSYKWKSIGKIWLPSVTEITWTNPDPFISDHWEQSYNLNPYRIHGYVCLDHGLTRTMSYRDIPYEIIDEDVEDGTLNFIRTAKEIIEGESHRLYPCIRLRF